jgi:hypothetical protein
MSKTKQVLEIAQKVGVIRAKELEAQGFHRQYLYVPTWSLSVEVLTRIVNQIAE